MMEQEHKNGSIGCNVKECKFNVQGANCSLPRIHVGCCCEGEHCTCCDSFEKID